MKKYKIIEGGRADRVLKNRWLRRGAACLLVAGMLVLMGLGDAPQQTEETNAAEPVRIIKYIPTTDPDAPPASVDPAALNRDPEPEQEPEPVCLGEFVLTAYCSCEICCGQWSNPEQPRTASGEPAVEGVTVGADWDTIPAGSAIEIEGLGERIVQDKPAGWIIERYNGKVIDVYFDNHEAALAFGKRTANVYLKGDAENVSDR